jgi:hypothetical protein
VENTTDEDWKDVRLSLVSGRPISFIQDLRQPLYVPRPIVQAQVIGSPTPQLYREGLDVMPPGLNGMLGGMGGFAPDNGLLVPAERKITLSLRGVPLRAAVERLFEGTGEQFAINPDVQNVPITLELNGIGLHAALRLVLRQAAEKQPGLTFSKDGSIFLVKVRRDSPAPAVVEEAPPEYSDTLILKSMQRVASQATGADRGALFTYEIKQPVTLNRQRAAMVPILSAAVAGEAVSIFDPQSDSVHPLRGFRLKNTTGLHLSGGPITVYQDGGYAGDAQISYLQPGEERLLSYAVDLDVVADLELPRYATNTTSVSARDGVLTVTRKQREERLYRFRNKSAEPRTLIVQQSKQEGWKLAAPEKPAEETPGELRFRLQILAGKSMELKVVTERPTSQTLALTSITPDLLVSYAQNAEVPEKLRAALKQLVALRRKQSEMQAQRTALEAELKAIDTDQDRIRKNMQSLDRNSPLYQSYVKKLTEQEARIEQTRAEIGRLREAETTAASELRQFTDSLTIE